MNQPDLQTHEAKFHLHYEELGIYWALSKLLFKHTSDDEPYLETEVKIDGEPWEIRLNYSESGIAPRPGDDIASDTVYEFDLTAEGYSQRKVSVNFSPRWENLRTPDFDHIDTPWDYMDREGVDAHVQGSNIELDDYPGLVARLIVEIASAYDYGWRQELEPFGGRIYEVERYLRLLYEMNKKLIGDTGIMQRFMMVLSEEQGTYAEYTADNDGCVGKFHAIKLHDADIPHIFPQHHAFGRQLKSYLPREDDIWDEDDALYHPKVGALYRKSLTDGTSIPWSDRDELLQELDETVLNSLVWSDIPIDVGDELDSSTNGIFVSDDHFSVQPRLNPVTIYPDPTPDLEAKQDSILMWALQQIGSTESDKDVAKALTDGGMHREDLVEETGWSMSTLYRCLDRLEGAIESRNGHFRFASRQLQRDIEALIERVDDFKQTAVSQAERLIDVEIRSKSNSAFERFLAKYGAEFIEDQNIERPVIRIGTLLSEMKSHDYPHPEDVIQELKNAWRNDHRDLEQLRGALLKADLAEQSDYQTFVH